MASFVQLLVIAAAITVAYGQTAYVNSSAQDYYHLARRELTHQIEIAEIEIASVNARYADRLDIIQAQQDQVLLEIQQLTTHDKAKTQLKLCYDKAALAAATLTYSPQSNINSAKDYTDNQLPRRVDECDRNYPKNQTALEICYVNSVGTATDAVNYYVDNAHDQLDTSLYTASATSNTAVQCSFLVEKEALETIGQTTKLINSCEDSLNQQNPLAASSNTDGMVPQN